MRIDARKFINPPSTPPKRESSECFSGFQSMPSTPLSARWINKAKTHVLIPDMGGCQNRIHEIIDQGQDFPSIRLDEFFNHCSPNPSSLISSLVYSVKDKLKDTLPMVNIAIKLYFHLLESMVLAESERCGKNNFSAWLNDKTFHCSLLAICSEIVRFVFEVQPLSTADIFKVCEITCIDYIVLVEMVIKCESNFPWIVIKRLKEIEERSLESTIWDDKSPFYSIMTAEDLSKENSSTKKALAVISQVVPALYGEAITRHQNNQQIDANKPTRTQLFRLLWLRLQFWTIGLALDKEVVQGAWDVIIYIVENESRLTILKNRHLDQILICIVYGVCKILNCEKSFKEILCLYKDQPQFQDSTYRCVYMGPNEPSVDIIRFYNTIFIPTLKPIIYGLRPQLAGFKSSISEFSRNNKIPLFRSLESPRRISVSHNIYLSPMKSNRALQFNHAARAIMSPSGMFNGSSPLRQMTPRTKLLYGNHEPEIIKAARKLEF
ncbi:Retinoblastoma-associated protein, A-box domain-containing protein [Rozella allomycis CSF55]|uniref:Retinoblastoma-associated protein, A-box domain-containing protein n=1 Tax=Rozella allomycis (strain CSF55) TaxID=988480 RepID=A0A075AT73_ROZAC|nr:Retinoblastoma-associated protein, A-box domain-containing protein [Rozella allomycis CSF55]|eukprot:EPZ33476.1 Retinoblastoma-associated protein, A-box domain-containing protein [Rozella allomycis CSF55]